MKKWLVSLAAVSVFIASTLAFLLFSQTGLSLVLRVLSPLTDGAVTIEDSDGSIAGGWWLSGLKIRSEGADISVKEIGMDWQLSTLFKGNVHATAISIKEVEIIVREPGNKVQEQASSPFTLPLIAIPLTIIVDQLTVDGGIVNHVDRPAPLFVLNHLSLRIQASADQLIVEEVSVKSPEFETTLNGKLRFSKDWPLEFQGEWMVELAEYSPVSGTMTLSGTASSPEYIISVSDPLMVNLNGKISDIFDTPSWQVNGEAESLNPQNISPQWPELVVGATVEASGTIDKYRGRITTVIEADEYAPASVDLAFSGNQSNLAIEPVTVTIGNGETTVTALVDWQNELSWQVNGKVEALNPGTISPEWPLLAVDATFESAGTIDEYRGRINVVVEVDETTSPAVDLSFSGNQSNLSIEPATVTIGNSESTATAMVDWQNDLKWHLLAEINDFELSAIDPSLVGIVSMSAATDGSYDKDLQYHLQVSEFAGAFDALNQHVLGGLTLDGNEDGLEILSADFSLGEGHVDIAGTLKWRDAISWDTRVLLQSFDPSVIETTIKGSVNAELKSHGTFLESVINGGIELKNVSGLLAGYELSGGGTIDYLDGNIDINNLFLQNGKNHLEIDGRIDQTLDLAFALDGPELNRVIPSLNGMISAHGNVSGSKEFPELSAMIKGDTLSYQDYSVGSIASEINVSTGLDGEIKTSFEGREIKIAGYHIEQATAELTGSMENHHLAVNIDSDQGTLQLLTDGVLRDLKIWEAEIKKLHMEHPRFGAWQNNGKGNLLVSAESVDVRDFCISSERVEFCSEGSWKGPAMWSFNTSKIKVELAALNDWSILDPVVKGVVHGAVSGSGDRARLSSFVAEFALDEVVLGIEKNEYYQELKWFDTAVSIKLDNRLLKTELYSRFVDDSFIKGTLGISGVDDLSEPFADLPLEGNLQTVLQDMNPLKILTGGYLEPTGRLSADLALSGSVGDPRVSGDIDLVDGEIKIPQLNITPKHINVSVKGRDDSLQVELDAVSGEGTVSAEGEFRFNSDSWLGKLKIVGQNVQLVQQKEVEITADSDLLLTIGPDGGRLEGTLVVPKALIQPEEMTGSESESDDVIIMGEADDVDSWPFNLAVKIELGENVKVNGYGLSGNLKGSLDLANTRNAFLAGHGELYLDDGLFSFYDRELEITRGRILFGGGPVDNPGLDVSARSTIEATEFGKDDIIVGVNIIGSVDDFEMELFSIPSMDDADIISYIVVGTSMSSSDGSESGAVGAALSAITKNRGNKILGDIGGAFAVDDLKIKGSGSDDASLVVGKQMLEDLYMSYDFNLYKNAGYFTIRYDFGRGFSVESKNSMESTGVNLLYSFER
jgi:translocation and assembly module TamB